MKKILYILLATIFCFSLAACGNNTSQSPYTKEFSYIPSYSSNMELQSFTPPSQGNQAYGTAKYIIKNTNNNDVLQNYENILKKDGWTIYEDKKPNSIAAKKGTHQVALIPVPSGADVQLTIISK